MDLSHGDELRRAEPHCPEVQLEDDRMLEMTSEPSGLGSVPRPCTSVSLGSPLGALWTLFFTV